MRELKANDVAVTYLLFPDEGHLFQKPSSVIALTGLIEGFLAREDCLGGRFEPVGDDLENSSGIIVDDP